jgi:hypothetical protein
MKQTVLWFHCDLHQISPGHLLMDGHVYHDSANGWPCLSWQLYFRGQAVMTQKPRTRDGLGVKTIWHRKFCDIYSGHYRFYNDTKWQFNLRPSRDKGTSMDFGLHTTGWSTVICYHMSTSWRTHRVKYNFLPN